MLALSVDCVIFRFDENKLKVLLIHSDIRKYRGKWSLPGDHVKQDEDPDMAAARVIKQRTGLSDVYLEQVKTFGSLDRHNPGREVTVAYSALTNINHPKLKLPPKEQQWQPIGSMLDMAFGHQQILETAYCWLQRRVLEHPLGLSLLPNKFSLRELQNLYEAILELKFDRRNFRKKFFAMDFLVDVQEIEQHVSHRPGKLYKFDYEKYGKKKKKWTGIDF